MEPPLRLLVVAFFGVVACLGAFAIAPQRAAAAVATTGVNRLDTFIRGTDNQLWHRHWDGAHWGAWEPLGGYLTADPAAVASAGGRIDVFVRGGDWGLWHKVFDGTAWGPYQSMGGPVYSAPAVASWAGGRLDLFVTAASGNVMHKWSADAGATWDNWENLGGQSYSEPDAVSWGAGRIDVVVRGSDSRLWHQWFDGGAWQGWQPLGGVLTSGPGIASWSPNRLDVFARAGDQGLWHTWWDGVRWNSWQPLGGQLTSNVFATSWGPNRIDVFARGTDNGVYHKWWDGRAWSYWEAQGGQMVAGSDASIIGVPVYRQAMNLDCETAALQMALAYTGHNYTQQDLFALENPDTRPPVAEGGLIRQWGDPYTNFVGDVNGTDVYPPTGYGIYYPVIQSIAQSHGAAGATGHEAFLPGDLYQALADGHAVAAWVEVGWYRPAVHYWTAWDGRSIRYTLDEHTVVLSGISPSSVRINDPWHGTQYWIDKATFETSFADFNDMAIVFQ